MRIAFMGTPDFSVPILDALAERHDVAAVYCQPPRPAGRGQKERPSPVQSRAEALGIAVRTPKGLRKAPAQDAFSALDLDVAVVAAYGLILPPAILSAPRHGCLNVHASLLPRWRGAAPIQRAIMAGDGESGVTIMQMDVGLDTGAMLLKDRIPITDATTAGSLHDELSAMGARLIIDALEALAARSLTATPQPADGITYAEKIDKAEARIDFTQPAPTVLRHIHGLSPFPGAYAECQGERIKLLKVELADASGRPATIADNRMTIACGSGAIRPLIVQRAGKGPIDVAAFLRGYALPVGTRLA